MKFCKALAFACSLALAGAFGFGVKFVLADGIPSPNPLYYSGTLTEAGQLVNGSRSLTVNLWLNAMPTGVGEHTICTSTTVTTNVINGRFRIALDSSCKGAINANPNVFTEVVDGTTSLGRSVIGAVPYAVEADHAVNATNATHATSADNATNATAAVTASAAGGALATTISSIQSNITALQGAQSSLTTIVQTTAVSGDTFYADCTSPTSSTIFPQGACPRMASRKCVALGYKDGWFEGDLHGSDPVISCVK